MHYTKIDLGRVKSDSLFLAELADTFERGAENPQQTNGATWFTTSVEQAFLIVHRLRTIAKKVKP